MYNLDSLSLKYFYEENFDYISGSIVQKIQQISRYEVIFNLRNLTDSQNKKLYININPKYPHICFVDEDGLNKRNVTVPSKPPMFCMQLRKYLNGSKIKDFKLVEYERIIEFYFDYFDEIGSLTRICLAVEIMGKHSNIILYNAQNMIIIGAMHNISPDKSSVREIYGGINYIYPPKQNKLNILKTSYSTFFEIAKDNNIKAISDNFYYFSQSLLNQIIKNSSSIAEIFEKMQKLQSLDDKDFMINYWNGMNSINSAINSYYSNEMFKEILSKEKLRLKKYISGDLKKLFKTISSEITPEKLEKYKLFGDTLMTNLYQIKKGQKLFEFGDIRIELDENLTPAENAQKFYALYKKQKSSIEHNKIRITDAKKRAEYLEGIVFDIDNASNFNEINEIQEELAGLGLINLQKTSKKQDFSINKLEFQGFDIYYGKNNKQNDFLISKIASGEDLWFHVLNCPSSHVILKVKKDKQPTKEALEYCAKLAKDNSKAKNSGKTPIIMTKRKNLKKPPDTYLGYVTYKNETEIVI